MEADSPLRRESARPKQTRALRRKPKQLDEAPTAFETSGSGSGMTALLERGCSPLSASLSV
ncbi:hypothetical protein CZ774_13080 [Frigoribacterium sp. JB110]|nr:hypothetical protein CZ774_13080 [Frigoribacterium sp. JB110]